MRSPATRTSPTSRLVRVLVLVVGVAALAIVAVLERDVIAATWRRADPRLLLVVLALLGAQLIVDAQLWRVALSDLGVRVLLRRMLAVHAAALPANYVPGSVWGAVGRTAALRGDGVPARLPATVAVLEVVLTVGVGVPLGLLLSGGALPGELAVGWVLLGVVAALLLASPPVLGELSGMVLRRRGLPPVRLSTGGWLRVVALDVLHWANFAAAFTLYLAAVGALGGVPPLRAAGATLLAWVAGFVVPVAPQGVGIVEAALGAQLAPASPDATIGSLAVLTAGFRAVVLVRDLLAAATLGRGLLGVPAASGGQGANSC